jgi:predicted  nucleic acid-binding Zn-ribbon protein
MTDSTDAPPIPESLLALQAVDTEADQLAHRRAATPLHAQVAAAGDAVRAWEQERSAMQARNDELAASIESAEQRASELAAERTRLEQQLKTVIAPREAEALMHEIENVGSSVDELDVAELEALEEQAALDDRLSAHLQAEPSLRDTMQRADQALADEVAGIDAELAVLDGRRAELRGLLTDDVLATYDRKRSTLGVAVARLDGRQCQGCHLDLSPAEIDTVRDEAGSSGVTDCPQCGRLLIV